MRVIMDRPFIEVHSKSMFKKSCSESYYRKRFYVVVQIKYILYIMYIIIHKEFNRNDMKKF